MLVSLPRWFCFLSVTILWPVWVGSILMLLGSADTNGHAVYPGDEIIMSLVFSVITLWSGYLLVEHFRFRHRHGRAPNIDDFGPPPEPKREAPL